MNIEVKDCRTCPMRQEDPNLSNSRDFSYLCNMEKKVLLQLAPESVTSEQTFLPEQCPLKANNFEIRLIGSEPTVIIEMSSNSKKYVDSILDNKELFTKVPIKEKKPRKPRVTKKAGPKDGTNKPGVS